jgi:ribosomal protein S18 acetylase RimI-like enzyme
MGWKELQSGEIHFGIAAAETQRFGFPVLNVQCGVKVLENIESIGKTLIEQDYGLAVVRYPSSIETVGSLLASLDMKLISTDSTVYWSSSNKTTFAAASSRVDIQQVGVDRLSDLVRTILSSFAGYRSHWHYNPRTNHVEMAEAYSEWVTNFINRQDIYCYIISVGSDLAGMAMVQSSGEIAEILLAGIVREYQSQGLYQNLISYVEHDLRQKSAKQIVISTQSQNIRVQKSWARYGLVPQMSVQTIHVEKKERRDHYSV